MQFHKWFKEKRSSSGSNQKSRFILSVRKESQKRESRPKTVKIDEKSNGQHLVLIYLASHSPLPAVLAILQLFNENEVKVSQLCFIIILAIKTFQTYMR